MPNWAPLQMRQRESGAVSIVIPAGKLALGPEINELRTQLRQLLDQQRYTLVDLSEVTVVDSTGIGILVEAQAHAIGVSCPLRICSLSPAMSFQISRLCLEKILPIYENEAAALADWT